MVLRTASAIGKLRRGFCAELVTFRGGRAKNLPVLSRLAVTCLSFCVGASTWAASPRVLLPGAPIAIENGGRHSIYNLYAAPAGQRRWGPDRFEDATIPPRRNRTVAIPHRSGRCDYRLKLVLADRSTRVRKVDVCRGGRWTVTEHGDSFEPAEPKPVRQK